jgi:uncharacterized repeat protein (TIGR01451 family)
MRHHHRFVRVLSILVLVLLFGGSFPARFVPAVQAAGLWYVSQTGDDAHDCLTPASACATINGALDKFAPGDTILVDSGTYTREAQFAPVIEITKEVILSGGWNATFTTQEGYTIIDGHNSTVEGILSWGGSFPVLIRRFIVQNNGIGIENNSTILTLDHCIIQNNHHNHSAGGLDSSYSPIVTILDSIIRNNFSSDSGGMNVYGENAKLIIRNSSITGNDGHNRAGGVHLNNGLGETGLIENTTISGNSSDYSPGAVHGPFEIYNSTITDNSSKQNGGGVSGAITLYNSILAGNSAPDHPNCYDGIISGGYNLFNITNGCLITTQPSDQSIADPGLSPLQGDPGFHYLHPDSPAIDAGNPAGCLDHSGALLDADQRGMPRLGRCDIGAIELQPLEFTTFSVDHANAHPNQVLTFTALLRNDGPDVMSGVTLANTLPSGITYVLNSLQASSGAAFYSGGEITWSGDVDPVTPITLTYQATAGETQTVDNTVEITYGSQIIPRSVAITITPWVAYIPTISKPCPFVFADFFDNPKSGWTTTNNNNFNAQYLPGEYQLLVKVPDYFVAARAPSEPIRHVFQVSVDVRNITGVLGSYGMLFGATEDWRNFYRFEILPNQTWAVRKWDGSNWQHLGGGFSSAIRTGSQKNTLTVRHEGDYSRFWINKEALPPIYDPASFTFLYVGVTANSIDAVPLDVRFSNFIVPDDSCAVPGLMPARSILLGGLFTRPSSQPAP